MKYKEKKNKKGKHTIEMSSCVTFIRICSLIVKTAFTWPIVMPLKVVTVVVHKSDDDRSRVCCINDNALSNLYTFILVQRIEMKRKRNEIYKYIYNKIFSI